MKLPLWLKEQGLTLAAFGARIETKPGVIAGPGTIQRYCLAPDHPRFRMPTRRTMVQIYVETGGAVQPNDFHDLPDLGELEAAATVRAAREVA